MLYSTKCKHENVILKLINFFYKNVMEYSVTDMISIDLLYRYGMSLLVGTRTVVDDVATHECCTVLYERYFIFILRANVDSEIHAR